MKTENKEWWRYVRPGHTLQCLGTSSSRFEGSGYELNRIFKVVTTNFYTGRDNIPRGSFQDKKGLTVWSDSCEPCYQIGDWVIVKSSKQSGKGNGISTDDLVSKLYEKDYNYASGMLSENSAFSVNVGTGWRNIHLDHIQRYATEEEIQLAQTTCTEEDEFVLPEKWQIRITKENKETVHKWKLDFTSYVTLNKEDEYVSYKGSWYSKSISDCTEITFDQFKKYVLKEKTSSKEEQIQLKEERQKPEEDPLIEEAKRRYPVGTKFYPAHLIVKPLKEKNEYCIITNATFKFNDNYIYALTDEERNYDSSSKYGTTYYNRVVYENGRWAEIVSSTSESNDSLLEKARREYPKGTKYISLDSMGNTSLNQIAEYKPGWTYDTQAGGIEVGVGYIYNLKKDKWAVIIEKSNLDIKLKNPTISEDDEYPKFISIEREKVNYFEKQEDIED